MIVSLIAIQDLSRNHLESHMVGSCQLHTYLIMSTCNVTQPIFTKSNEAKYLLGNQLT